MDSLDIKKHKNVYIYNNIIYPKSVTTYFLRDLLIDYLIHETCNKLKLQIFSLQIIYKMISFTQTKLLYYSLYGK